MKQRTIFHIFFRQQQATRNGEKKKKMWSYIVWNIVMSVLVIATAHSLWQYWNESYSPKRAKDVVGYQTQKYKDMMQELLSTKEPSASSTIQADVYLLPEDKASMIAELRSLVMNPP